MLPIQIFISPNFMVGREAVGQHVSTEADVAMNFEQHAPPLYGDHQLDQLWSDIDPTGYATPANAASGATTPLQVRSRSASIENLASLEAISHPLPGAVPAQMLQHRLTNLPEPGPSRRRPGGQGYSTPQSGLRRGMSEEDNPAEHGPGSPEDASNPVSRQTSVDQRAESPLTTPEHIDYDTESLSKVPSYHTAMLTLTTMPLSGDLPNYEAATGNTFRPSPLGPNSTITSPAGTSSPARRWLLRHAS